MTVAAERLGRGRDPHLAPAPMEFDGGMARANRQIRAAFDTRSDWASDRAQRRRCLRAIDGGLDRLEQLHSADIASGADVCRRLVGRIAAEAGVIPPARVQRAATSFHLHTALLLWQESVLDRAVPHRRSRYPDLGAEVEEIGIPGRPRRVGSTRRAARIA
ncbi:MAG TPA: hypothetical protein VNN74_00590 [Candidatus Micrarchaeia archaeon]|nr:hypothetical protein [Candidatus Micrarchaeia archaeon]